MLDAAGHQLSVTELRGRTVNYTYDNLYRLTSETIANDPHGVNGAVNYTVYDAVGNRKQMTSTLAPVPAGLWNYDANDRFTTGDTYDANGNTVSSGGISYAYDFENHLVQKGGMTVVYDGDGNRVSKTVGGVTTTYLVDDLNPTGYAQVVLETTGSETRQYGYGLELISQLRTYTVNGAQQTQKSYYVYDGHGSVRALADATGAVTDTYDYDAFGNLLHSIGSTPNNYLFAGEQFDPDLNLYYNRARYLNVATGRFWTMDTYEGDDNDPLSLHKYAYAEGDPTNSRDHSGNEIDEVCAALSMSMTLDALPNLLFPAPPSAGSLQIDFKGENYTGLNFEHGSGVGGPFEDPGRGWFWNIAMKATLTSGLDASQYRVKQTARWTASGAAYYGEGLQKFLPRSGIADPDDPLEGSYRADKNILYAIDGPGIGTILGGREPRLVRVRRRSLILSPSRSILLHGCRS